MQRRKTPPPQIPPEAVAFCEGARALPVRGVRGGNDYSVDDWVADEVPVALEYNGISHTVMLATPLDLADFALGFSLSEGILSDASELYGVEEEASALGITLHLSVAAGAFARLKERRRSMTGRTLPASMCRLTTARSSTFNRVSRIPSCEPPLRDSNGPRSMAWTIWPAEPPAIT